MSVAASNKPLCLFRRVIQYSKVLSNIQCRHVHFKHRLSNQNQFVQNVSHSPYCDLINLSRCMGKISPRYHSTLVHECWKCGIKLHPDGHQYFCHCGVVQPPKICRDYFSVMGLEIHFDVDVSVLKKNYTNLQRQLHPDKFSQRCETEKEFSLQQSSTINKAYNTLLKPLSRGLYMLELNNASVEEDEIQMDAAFLMDIMEINENLLEAESLESLGELEEQNNLVIENLISDISRAFSENNISHAKVLLAKFKYFSNIDDKIRDLKSLFVESKA